MSREVMISAAVRDAEWIVRACRMETGDLPDPNEVAAVAKRIAEHLRPFERRERLVVGIAATYRPTAECPPEGYCEVLVACDDGAVFEWSGSGWRELFPVPETPEAIADASGGL